MRLTVIVALVLIAALTACSPTPKETQPMRRVEVLALGDSNTDATFDWYGQGEQWPSLTIGVLAAAHPETDWSIENLGAAGATSEDVAGEIRDVMARTNPDIVCCMIGTNDVANALAPDVPPLSLSETEANLRTIIEAVKADGALLVLMQPPPATSKAAFESGRTPFSYWCARTPQEGSSSLVQVKAMCTTLGEEYEIPVVRVWDETAALGFDGGQLSPEVQRTYLVDGVHLTARQQANISRWTAAAIEAHLDEVVASTGATSRPGAANR